MFEKATTLRGMILKKKHPSLVDSETENYQELLQVCLLTQRWHIEVLGQHQKLGEALEALTVQAEVLRKINKGRLKRYPILEGYYWEQVVAIQNVLKEAKNSADRQDIADRLSNLLQAPDLNSSNYKTPAANRFKRVLDNQAPSRRLLPVSQNLDVDMLPKFEEKIVEESADADVDDSDSPPKSSATKKKTESSSSSSCVKKTLSKKKPPAKSSSEKSSDSSAEKEEGNSKSTSKQKNAAKNSGKKKRGGGPAMKIYQDGAEPSANGSSAPTPRRSARVRRM